MILQAMDNKKLTAMVLLDMSKAFDRVDHKRMISKLQDAGVSSILHVQNVFVAI